MFHRPRKSHEQDDAQGYKRVLHEVRPIEAGEPDDAGRTTTLQVTSDCANCLERAEDRDISFARRSHPLVP
jgi:hypothetical protein